MVILPFLSTTRRWSLPTTSTGELSSGMASWSWVVAWYDGRGGDDGAGRTVAVVTVADSSAISLPFQDDYYHTIRMPSFAKPNNQSECGEMQEKHQNIRLTTNTSSTKRPQPLFIPCLIASRSLPHALIARRQKHDDHQRDKERERACHPPLREDDAEVLGGPCEEHLGHQTILAYSPYKCKHKEYESIPGWTHVHTTLSTAHIHTTVAAVATMAHVHIRVVHVVVVHSCCIDRSPDHEYIYAGQLNG